MKAGSAASQALLDTSVFIASESGRPLDTAALPDESFISVITLAELRVGVHAAPDTATRAVRLKTLEAIADIDAFPVDADAAGHWAMLRFRLREAGLRVNVNHLWIASIALAHGLAVVTQDRDFEVLTELGGPEIIQV
ncbi:type II toxin-antitoxin system VapC family toxin [Rathayibacter soli]|uniref:type II toxin-antitoxin system VapC family toxin n=1 Tax=Rathayibacter soli TaxID=3144168 RepID=UPI0027E413C6|nr:type II toxin-antitoxin system VapC family toxin [Glaciibacter superstes]